jgi:hypothetical protein
MKRYDHPAGEAQIESKKKRRRVEDVIAVDDLLIEIMRFMPNKSRPAILRVSKAFASMSKEGISFTPVQHLPSPILTVPEFHRLKDMRLTKVIFTDSTRVLNCLYELEMHRTGGHRIRREKIGGVDPMIHTGNVNYVDLLAQSKDTLTSVKISAYAQIHVDQLISLPTWASRLKRLDVTVCSRLALKFKTCFQSVNKTILPAHHWLLSELVELRIRQISLSSY